MHRTTIDSPIGTITLVADDDALVEVHLPDEKIAIGDRRRGHGAVGTQRAGAGCVGAAGVLRR